MGPGISTYHHLLVLLIGLFSILTIVHIPVWNIYKKQNEKSGLATYSLGNMGFSKTECLIESTVGVNHIELKCQSAGYITELLDFGVTTAQED